MYNLEEQINNVLYVRRDKWYSALSKVSAVSSVGGITVLVYRFGFILTDYEYQVVSMLYNILFVLFFIKYLARYVLSLEKLDFFRKNWFESTLNLLVLFHGAFAYVSNGMYPLLLLIEELGLSSQPLLLYDHLLSLTLTLLVGIEVTKLSARLSELNIQPAASFIYSFVLLIGSGAFMLMLPAMSVTHEGLSLLDALFMSVSASCVTGLAVVDVGTYFSFKGQLIIMLLAQLGGIGIISFATFFATFLSKGVGLKHQSIIKDHLSSESLVSAKGLLKKVIFITISIELIGFLIIFFSWGEDLKFNTFGQKVFFSLFHSVSAFCNAGFSLFSDGLYTNSISEGTAVFAHGADVNVRRLYLLHLVIALLIILGGIGFSTIENLLSAIKKRKSLLIHSSDLSLSSRIVLSTTGLLLLLGTAGFMLLEAHQLTDRNILEALGTAFFQSVTTRTAGFHTMNFGGSETGVPLANPTIILCLFLMFIGAAPGSTGGGIKNTTFFLIVIAAIANIRGKQRIEIYRRNISNQLVSKAYSVFMFATSYNILAVFLLSISESGNEQINILQIVFEQVSAFSTVGLSMGITSDLSAFGKLILIFSMFIGRVGTLTLALALSTKVISNSYRYPDGHVLVG